MAAAALCGLVLAQTLAPAAFAAGPAKPAQPAAPAPPPPPPPAPPQPYDGQLLRLSEILGSLSYLASICDPSHKDPYRSQMQALLEAEASAPPRNEEFAGAFNRGYRGLEASYATCTENARALVDRLRVEGAVIARRVRSQYGS